MGLALLSRLPFIGRKARATAPRPAGNVLTCRPSLEALEDRVTPATLNLPIDVSDLNVTGTGADRALQAVLSMGGQEVGTAPIAVTTQDAPAAGECPILNLELGPINLNLLGLHVDTSAICLDVTATNHQGLLGGLLCDLSGGGLNLNGILGELGGLANQFLDRVEGLLDNVLSRPLQVTGVFGQSVTSMDVGALQEGEFCDILNLELGPVELRVPLLGVNVFLDNCADPAGPITVDVTADPNGGLLGSLLCGLADRIDLNGLNLNRVIQRVDRLIDSLTDLAGGLNGLSNQLDRVLNRIDQLVDRIGDVGQIERVIDQLDRVIDRLDDLADRLGNLDQLNQLTGQLGRVADQLGRIIDRLI